MNKLLLLWTAGCLLLLLFHSCSTTRYVPEGEYRLKKIVIETDGLTPKAERFRGGDLERYVRQTANRKLLGTNFYLWAYNASDTTRNNWWHRTLRRIGEPPVILDSALTERSADNIRGYMKSHGYFESSLDYQVHTRKQAATVTYRVRQGRPSRIGRIDYDFRDEFIRPIVLEDTVNTMVRSGDIFDIGVLNAERARITEYLRNNGYYDFSVNNISYVADSSAGGRVIDITMVVKQHLAGYTGRGEPVYDNNTIYRISDIYLNPDYDPVAAVSDPSYYADMDTMNYRGLNIIYKNRPKVRPRILRQTVSLYPNYLYDAREVRQTYNNIMRLGYYRSAGIVFENVSDSLGQNLVTFVGEEGSASMETTTEGYLVCNINAIPALRQSYRIDLEGSGSSNFYALGATIGYQNRNLLRGAELFDASVTGRYEFIRTKGKSASFEVGASVGATFPRFITPVRVDRYNRAVNPRTRLEVSVNQQNRPYYHRTLSGIRWGYSWGNRGNSTFSIRPVDVNLVKIGYIDQSFLESLKNRYLRESYTEQLVAGISGSYVYNNQPILFEESSGSLLFRLNWETTGNLFWALTHLMSSPARHSTADDEYYNIFGIRYAQYVRLDAAVSKRVVLSPKVNFAYRFWAGGAWSYGNQKSVPFDRLFYSGGTNSMRGWLARTLGPGSVAVEESSYPTQLGNFKLEANAELRFPIWGFLNGAVFADVGNVWLLSGGDGIEDDAIFRFDRFYRQLGFNTGLGIRFDFSFFIFRFDWGVKLHNPNIVDGSKWIDRFRWGDTVLQFGVGYPF